MYAGNDPVQFLDPTGRCFGVLEWLNDLESMNCHNLRRSIEVIHDPNATPDQQSTARWFIGVWGGAHAVLLASAIVITGGIAGAVIEWATPYVLASPTLSTVTVGATTAGSTLAGSGGMPFPNLSPEQVNAAANAFGALCLFALSRTIPRINVDVKPRTNDSTAVFYRGLSNQDYLELQTTGKIFSKAVRKGISGDLLTELVTSPDVMLKCTSSTEVAGPNDEPCPFVPVTTQIGDAKDFATQIFVNGINIWDGPTGGSGVVVKITTKNPSKFVPSPQGANSPDNEYLAALYIGPPHDTIEVVATGLARHVMK